MEQLSKGPPSAPDPIEISIPPWGSRDDRLGRIQAGIEGWDQARSRLHTAAARDDEHALTGIGLSLTKVLAWIRLLDEMLLSAWQEFSGSVREAASRRADIRLRKVDSSYGEPPDFSPFLDLRQREKDGEPYSDWAAALAGYGGNVTRGDLQAFRWLAGKLLHLGPRPAVELRHWQSGAEPRWKWLPPDRIVPADEDERSKQRRAYERFLAGHDLLGSLNLIGTWIEAEYFMIRLYKEAGEYS